jgi:hypothetical protein
MICLSAEDVRASHALLRSEDTKTLQTLPMAKKISEEDPKAAQGGSKPAGPSTSSSSLFAVCLAAWLVPGMGHLLLGRKWRSLILFTCIVGMFVLGLAMQGQYFALGSPSYLHTLGYFAELSVGVPMRAATFFGYGGGDTFFVCSDYGTAYLIGAGMLNLLTILDAYDIAMGRKA